MGRTLLRLANVACSGVGALIDFQALGAFERIDLDESSDWRQVGDDLRMAMSTGLNENDLDLDEDARSELERQLVEAS